MARSELPPDEGLLIIADIHSTQPIPTIDSFDRVPAPRRPPNKPQHSAVELTDPTTKKYKFWFLCKCGIALGVALPVGVVALVFALSIVGIPVAIVLFGLASWPFHRVQKKDIRVRTEWLWRDHSLNENDEKPWEM